MSILDEIRKKAREQVKTIVFPEGDELRTVQAAAILKAQGLAEPILLGDPDRISDAAEKTGSDLSGICLLDPAGSPDRTRYRDELYRIRKEKGVSIEDAERLISDPMYFGIMMVKQKDADGLVSGAVHSTGDMLRPALQIIKTKPGIKVVSSGMLMEFQNRDIGYNGLLVYADCVVNPCPTAEELAHIAISSAETAHTLGGIECPRVALLSFSTKGSAKHALVGKVQEAAAIAHGLAPDLILDGEMQFDAALVPEVGLQKAGGSPVAGRANVLIFPDLQAGNIGYKITQRLAGAEAIAVLQGLAGPCNDLSRGCSVEDIVNTACATAVQAQSP
ncbi:MAG: phosphate acetyltransferase [Lachnospiraceae bacterium]|nr:phosphate acetyltransferase [Lachnospiraceae bacterium]